MMQAYGPAHPPSDTGPPVGAWSGGSALPGLLMALGISVLVTVAILRGRRLRRRARRAGESPRDFAERVEAEARARRSLEAVMAEVQEHTRLCAAQIENRSVRLEQLIAMADDRLARLGTPADAVGPSEPTDAPPAVHVQTRNAAPAPPPSRADAPPPDPLTRQVYELADEGCAPVDIARRLDETTGKVQLILALRRAS